MEFRRLCTPSYCTWLQRTRSVEAHLSWDPPPQPRYEHPPTLSLPFMLKPQALTSSQRAASIEALKESWRWGSWGVDGVTSWQVGWGWDGQLWGWAAQLRVPCARQDGLQTCHAYNTPSTSPPARSYSLKTSASKHFWTSQFAFNLPMFNFVNLAELTVTTLSP